MGRFSSEICSHRVFTQPPDFAAVRQTASLLNRLVVLQIISLHRKAHFAELKVRHTSNSRESCVSLIYDALNMIRDIRSKGGAIRAWGALLNMPQVLGGLLFIATIEGQAIFLTVILTLIVAGRIHRREPFSRLTGICHLPWIALLPWLIRRTILFDHSMVQTGWMIYVAATISISLVFDLLDAVRYLRGDKKFSWAD